jgi:hypothetical protein
MRDMELDELDSIVFLAVPLRSGRLQGLFRQSLLACVRAWALRHPVAVGPCATLWPPSHTG